MGGFMSTPRMRNAVWGKEIVIYLADRSSQQTWRRHRKRFDVRITLVKLEKFRILTLLKRIFYSGCEVGC